VALTYSDLIDIMLQRMSRLGLVAAEGMADAAEAELYLFQALFDITEMVDVPQYVRNNREIHITSDGYAEYAMPDDYGRLILPRVQNRRGVYLWDGVEQTDLEYLDPNAFARQYAQANETPRQFSVIGRVLWLFPTPDSNGGNNYTVRGLYVVRVTRPELEDEVALSYPSVLVDQALYRLASDMNRPMDALAKSRDEGIVRLSQGSR
jgi:hypothetical protein